MQRPKRQNSRGFTIIEVVIAAALAVIVVFSIAIVLVDSHRGWNAMYNRIYSDVVTDSHVARRMFDAVIRKSSSSDGLLLDADGQGVEVRYYADPNSTALDRYARFYSDGNDLSVEYGRVLSDGAKETLGVETVCHNVSSCTFKHTGRSLQMLLTLDNGSLKLTTVTSAVMHN